MEFYFKKFLNNYIDELFRDDLTGAVEALASDNVTQDACKSNLELLREKIRSATSSLTSVPKPLKFLRPHFETLKEVYEKITGLSMCLS